jgi:hypothetical protein
MILETRKRAQTLRAPKSRDGPTLGRYSLFSPPIRRAPGCAFLKITSLGLTPISRIWFYRFLSDGNRNERLTGEVFGFDSLFAKGTCHGSS